MSSSSSEATSSAEGSAPPPCAGCKHLRRRCVPYCAFAAYFPPDHGDQFAAVHKVFGASNVSKLLAEVPPAERAGVVESLVYEATARLRDPTFGCVSYITVLQHVLKLGLGDLAAARGALAGHVGAAAAFRPFEPEKASPEAKQAGSARLDAAVRFAREQDERMRVVRMALDAKRKEGRAEAWKDAAKGGQAQPLLNRQMAEAQQAAAAAQSAREQAVKMQQAAAAAQQQCLPDGHVRGQQMVDASESAAAAQAAREQAMMARQAAAAQAQQRHPIAAEPGTGLAFPDGRPLQQMADAQKLAASDQVAREQHLLMLLRLRQAEEQQQASAADVARKQDTMTRQALAATQKHRHPAEPYQQAMGLNATLGHERTAEAEMKTRAMREDELYYHTAVHYAAMGREHPNSSQQMVHAQQRAAAGDIAWEQEMMLRQATAAAAAELTGNQNMLAMMQQDAAAAAEAELSRDQNVMMMLQQAVGGGHQQTAEQIANAQQLSAAAELVARQQQDLTMVQQQAAAYAHAMPGSVSGATSMQAFQPGGSADAESFLAQQQPQTVNALGFQTGSSLPPPSLAVLPRQPQNDNAAGDDDGQLSHLTAYFGIPGPNLPPDGSGSS